MNTNELKEKLVFAVSQGEYFDYESLIQDAKTMPTARWIRDEVDETMSLVESYADQRAAEELSALKERESNPDDIQGIPMRVVEVQYIDERISELTGNREKPTGPYVCPQCGPDERGASQHA